MARRSGLASQRSAREARPLKAEAALLEAHEIPDPSKFLASTQQRMAAVTDPKELAQDALAAEKGPENPLAGLAEATVQ